MIVFDLQCGEGCAVFEAWFRSGAEFDSQVERGLVQCVTCGSTKVVKAPMAPRLPSRSASEDSSLAQLAALQAAALRESEWVGDRFVEEARSMHLGEMKPRPVHGSASAADAKALIDEGVPVAPLPFPVLPPNQVN